MSIEVLKILLIVAAFIAVMSFQWGEIARIKELEELVERFKSAAPKLAAAMKHFGVSAQEANEGFRRFGRAAMQFSNE